VPLEIAGPILIATTATVAIYKDVWWIVLKTRAIHVAGEQMIVLV
jgi:hypothetical protein